MSTNKNKISISINGDTEEKIEDEIICHQPEPIEWVYDGDEIVKSNHTFRKIISIILVICLTLMCTFGWLM